MAKALQSDFLTNIRAGSRQLPDSYTWTGGEVGTEIVPDRAPGQRYPSAGGGLPTISPITASWRFDPVVFNDGLIGDLLNTIGDEDAVTGSKKPKDRDGNPYGKGLTYIGTLTAVRTPDTDSSAAERAVLEIEFQPSNVS